LHDPLNYEIFCVVFLIKNYTHLLGYIQILVRMEQEQKVTEDARIAAERDAVQQKYVAHLLQVNLGATF
jgi:hypothetical protein